MKDLVAMGYKQHARKTKLVGWRFASRIECSQIGFTKSRR
jgi:hypothetical protein